MKSEGRHRYWKGIIPAAAMLLLIVAGYEVFLSSEAKENGTQTAYTESGQGSAHAMGGENEGSSAKSAPADTASAAAGAADGTSLAAGSADNGSSGSAAGSAPASGGEVKSAIPSGSQSAQDVVNMGGSASYSQSESAQSGGSGYGDTPSFAASEEAAADASSAVSVPDMGMAALTPPTNAGAAAVSPVRVESVLNMTLVAADPGAIDDRVAGLAAKQGGYVEENKSLNSQKCITVRIPTENLANFQTGMLSYGKIINSSLTKNDISDQYNGTQAQLDQTDIQRQKYETLLQQAKTEKEAAAYQKSLDDLQDQMEVLQGQLRDWDFDLQYAPVNIYMQIN